MEIIEVNHIQLEKEFIEIHNQLNQADPNWIQPLYSDVNAVFNPSKNKLLKKITLKRWILKQNQVCIGRIAAFINPRYKNKGDKYPVGNIGFFECIDNQDAANLLFDTSIEWLKAGGVQAVDGPVNIGERDKFWGLLVEGFHPPLYGMSYNPPYYQRLFETYGFQVFYNQFCFGLTLRDKSQFDDRTYRVHDVISKDSNFSARYLPIKNFDKIVDDLVVVYNKAYGKHDGNKQIKRDQAKVMLKAIKPVADSKLIWFAYYKEDPIAFFISIPDINSIFRKFKGKLNLINKLRFLIEFKLGKIQKIAGMIFGVIPEYHGKGVDQFIIAEAEQELKRSTNYTDVELIWIGDFNPKMINIAKKLGTSVSRRLVTYRYLFNGEEVFERHPEL